MTRFDIPATSVTRRMLLVLRWTSVIWAVFDERGRMARYQVGRNAGRMVHPRFGCR